MASRVLAAVFPWFERLGLHVVRNHFYSPIPDTRRLDDTVFTRKSALVGIEFDVDKQVERLRGFRARFAAEYESIPRMRNRHARDRFSLDNASFGSVDAEMWWCILRDAKPNRIIEVGSGNSTLLALEALAKNATEGHTCEYIVVDPYPRQLIVDFAERNAGFRLIRSRVQDVPMDVFQQLGNGDILFIDSSHVASIDSDVCFEILEVLPRLAPGVMIHIHDVMLPMNYPKLWMEHLYFWNEQYLLQAFLSFNDEFEIVFAGGILALDRSRELKEVFTSFEPGQTRPGSFWIRRRVT